MAQREVVGTRVGNLHLHRSRAWAAQGDFDLIAGEAVSNTRMEPKEAINERLTNLEIKASFAEDLVDHLNALVARQQDQIDLLLRELAALRQQGPVGEPGAPRNPRDDLPPHY